MLGAMLFKLYGPHLDRLSRRFGRGALFSLGGFVLALLGAGLIARQFVWPGLAVFALARVLAAIGDHTNSSPWAPVFEASAFAAIPFAFALADPGRAMALIFLIFGMSAEFVARARFGGGIMGGLELFFCFLLLAMWPGGLIAYGAGILCFVSAGARRI